jgi:hypothetical protein
MALRKPTATTPARLEANRRNARRSTGPRTEAGKHRSRLNALQNGRWAAALCWSDDSLRALGENPEEFQELLMNLWRADAPGDQLWEQQIEDLARLYWRRQRLERAWEVLVQGEMETSTRAALLAPLSAEGALLLQQLDTVDRAVDRKVRILLRLREAQDRQRRWAARQGLAVEEPGWGDGSELAVREELDKLAQEVEAGKKQARELEALLGGAKKDRKSEERSHNVVENAGSGANGEPDAAAADVARSP